MKIQGKGKTRKERRTEGREVNNLSVIHVYASRFKLVP